ncbi:D-aminoacyl-tRNA deacylase 1-like isoform X2 [Oscarella lobularis]|uniref:D-aminoacyl-tRNA deacylase 1-like isoform X2 n=1 Tax=Oscarella lobularis TaxID=121494 RepID=UPI00331326DF
MRAVVQRVTKASVEGKGLCVLVGISRNDTAQDVEYIVRKVLNLRVFDNGDKRWSKSVTECGYEVLCVSQFTLQAVLKGNKPDFHLAMGSEESKPFYEEFLAKMRKSYEAEKIKDGAFGAYMQVHIQNDGPVTIELESPASIKPDKKKDSARKEETLS